MRTSSTLPFLPLMFDWYHSVNSATVTPTKRPEARATIKLLEFLTIWAPVDTSRPKTPNRKRCPTCRVNPPPGTVSVEVGPGGSANPRNIKVIPTHPVTTKKPTMDLIRRFLPIHESTCASVRLASKFSPCRNLSKLEPVIYLDESSGDKVQSVECGSKLGGQTDSVSRPNEKDIF